MYSLILFDTITSVSISPTENHLLVNSMDSVIRIFDVNPFSNERLISNLSGCPHGFEKNLIRSCWSGDGMYVASGGGDRNVYVWDTRTRTVQFKLPGHKGCVGTVDWHPREPILLSGSVDKTAYLGELDLDVEL